jgi:hypothetical protein
MLKKVVLPLALSFPVLILGICLSASSGTAIKEEAGLSSGWSVPVFCLGTLLISLAWVLCPLVSIVLAHRGLQERVGALEAKLGHATLPSGGSPGRGSERS